MRQVPEWRGLTDDADIPPRVQLRIFDAYGGVCPVCTRKLQPGHYAFDHIVALCNGGEHREKNLRPVCSHPCHSSKTAADLKQKALQYPKRLANAGIKRKSRPMVGSKASGWKRKMSGELVRRSK